MVALFQPTRAAGNPTGSDSLATALERVERAFLNAHFVTEPGIREEDLARRYNNSTMKMDPVANPEESVKELVKTVVKDSIHCAAPTMIGHMTTSLPFYTGPLSKLITIVHANNVKVETGKGQTFVEREALAMLHRELYRRDNVFYARQTHEPSSALGLVCSGGTIANNTALWIARNKCMPADGDFLGIDRHGLFKGLKHYGYDGAAIIGSAMMHYSMKKSADVLGIGVDGLLTCPFNKEYQVDTEALKQRILDCKAKNIAILALVGIAGGTETGSIDDLNAIADLAKQHDIHFHVDAAWGGPIIFSSHKDLVSGIERADTVTMDGHKQLYTPMGCGLCLLREPTDVDFIKKTSSYIIRPSSHDLGKFSMEGSRPAVSMFLHANLTIMGVRGLGALVDRGIRMASYMVVALKASGQFELILNPKSNIVLYRWLPKPFRGETVLDASQNAEIDAVNTRIQEMQRTAGLTFVSRTTIFSVMQQARVVALRAVIANPLTKEADIDRAISDQARIAEDLASCPLSRKGAL